MKHKNNLTYHGYFTDKPMTKNMISLIKSSIERGLCDFEIWQLATIRHGPSGSNVIEGLLRRKMLDYFESNSGSTMRVTEKAREYFEHEHS